MIGFWSAEFWSVGFWSDLFWSGTSEHVGGGSGSKKRRVYVERDGEILVFANASRAAAYLAAQKEQENVAQADRVAPNRAKRIASDTKPVEVVKIDSLALLVDRYRLADDVSQLLRNAEYETLIAIYRRAVEIQDEDDVEILLLAA